MSVVVIDPPGDPIVFPEKLGYQPNDADYDLVLSMVIAATEELDGPGGWLGRALGPQTLELQLSSFDSCRYPVIRLPCPPLINVVSVKYLDGDGVDHTIQTESYGRIGERGIYPRPGFSWPSALCEPGSVRIRYRAGYTGTSAEDGGTGAVPERARQAVILAVRNMQSLSVENLFLRSEEVEGIGTTQYTVSDAASKIVRDTADRLLSTLRVFE